MAKIIMLNIQHLDHCCYKYCDLIGQSRWYKHHIPLVNSHIINTRKISYNTRNILIDTCKFYHGIQTNQITVFIALL